MAEPPKQDGAPQTAKAEIPKPPPKQNPVFRMMGLPNFRFRLPSRNWIIFWTVTGSFAAAVTYDRRQKKAVQKKWCDLVAHISQQTLPINQMPRKLTVFLSAAPGDGLGPSRTYFKEYIKPVLVAAAMDYDVIEGRKEGDVRYGTAEQIRRHRRKEGEKGSIEGDEADTATAIEMVRQKMQVKPEPGLRGDLVLGRHTWKEYVRGLHEGWLGPLDEPVPQLQPDSTLESDPSPIHPTTAGRTENPELPVESEAKLDENKKSEEEKEKKEKEKEAEKKKPQTPPAYLSTPEYSSAPLSPHIPSVLEPSQPLYQQHILGFLKFPIRFYHFLNRRKLADDLGRDTAAIVLGMNRPYQYNESFVSTGGIEDNTPVATKAPESDTDIVQTGSQYEQQSVLDLEEVYWHKSVRKPRPEGDTTEKVWLSDIALDPRIAERMRRFDLDPEEAQRAERIAAGIEKTKARDIEDMTQAKVIISTVEED